MPQPLSRVLPNANIIMSNIGDRVLLRHPDLAILLAESIATWSEAESFMLRLFVTMMGGPEDKAATIYLAMETQSAKTAAIVALANAHLSEENRDLLKAVLAVAKSRQKDRDRIAHGVWGESPNIPDALLLINQKDKIRTELSREYVLAY